MADVRVTPRPWLWVPRTKPIRMIEVHATRGSTTPARQKSAALNWVQSDSNNQGGWGSSFSYVIGTDGSMGTVLNDEQMPTYSAGYGGSGSTYAIDEYGISYELAQSAAQEPFTDACLRRAAKEIAAKCKSYGIPAVFLTIPNQSGTPPKGLVRHDRCQNGYVLGKTDPGGQFSESGFLALMRAEMEDDMALTAEQHAMLQTVHHFAKISGPAILADIHKHVHTTLPQRLKDFETREKARYEQLRRDIAAIGTVGGPTADAIAKKIADELAKRLLA